MRASNSGDYWTSRPTRYSYVGLLNDFRPLLQDTAPEMVAGLVDEKVDLVLLFPS